MKKRSDNSFSVRQFEKILNCFPQLSWTSLDIPEAKLVQQSQSRNADYKVTHDQYGDTYIELKEIGDADRFLKQRKFSDEIIQFLKGIFIDKAFDCRFDKNNPPNQNQLVAFKKFLLKVRDKIISPCHFVLPKDPDYVKPMVEIQRLDDNGEIVFRLYSPSTVSGKYPREKSSFEDSRDAKSLCIVNGEVKNSQLEEYKIFSSSDQPLVSLKQSHRGKVGGICVVSGVGGALNEEIRIRGIIDDANNQLKAHVSSRCPLGLVICPSGYRFADFDNLVEAILGDEQIEVKVAKDGRAFESEHRSVHGGNRALLPDKNTTISYIGWLDPDVEPPQLKIIHNEYSYIRLPFEFFEDANVGQFIMNFIIKPEAVVGHLTAVTSAQQLQEIRSNNNDAIELMREQFRLRKKGGE